MEVCIAGYGRELEIKKGYLTNEQQKTRKIDSTGGVGRVMYEEF